MEIFAMLADATRVRLILALGAEELSVNELWPRHHLQPGGIDRRIKS